MSGTTPITRRARIAAGTTPAAGRRSLTSTSRNKGRGIIGRRSARGIMVLGAQILFVIALLVAWQLASGRWVQSYLISNPTDVAKKLWNLLGDGAMQHNIWITTQELLLGYAIGAGSGIVVGWALGTVRFAGDVFEPIISAFNGIPKVALAPMFLLWFGLGMGSKVAIASMIVFFVLYYNVYTGCLPGSKQPSRSP